MANKKNLAEKENRSQIADRRSIDLTIDGHKITLKFAPNYNPELSPLVRGTLLDAFIRSNSVCPENGNIE